MTPADLQQLSRDAAGKLPKTPYTADVSQPFRYHEQLDSFCLGSGEWIDAERLHESTEAAAEIMVRVLWPARVWLEYANALARRPSIIALNSEAKSVYYDKCDNDPMLAFRVAVLRAVVAL